MPVKVRCSSCDKVFAVPDAARGKAVKCPDCEARVAVPAEESEKRPAAAKATADKSKKKPAAKAAKPADSEEFLTSLDLRKVEDTNARICSKCGFDMKDLEEEETECPKCGFDIESGGLGVKARKKAMRGPDPADFYPGLVKNSWKFVLKNQMLAWRTNAYIFACLIVSLLCAFLYLWISAWPPRVFFALCFFVAFLVIPGWLSFLDSEIIKLTLERKDKFKKLNFDFFLSSAKGVMFAVWLVTVAVPILLIPVGIGYYLVHMAGQPGWVLGICIGIGSLPVLWVLPVAMSHMTMPIPAQGWMVWRVVPIALRTAAPLAVWLMWFLVTNIPMIAGAAVIGGVWGSDIGGIVQTMESNADISRRLLAAENAPKGGKNAPPPIDKATIGTPAEVDFKPLIGPSIILAIMCLPLGYIGLFNMRTNGQFTYYMKDRLDLIDKPKEYKYVAKERRNEDDDDKPRTWQQDLTDGVVVAVMCLLLGGIAGMLYGNLTSVGTPTGVAQGVFGGSAVGVIVGFFVMLGIVFPFKQNEESRKGFIGGVTSLVVLLVTLGLALGGVVSLGFIGGAEATPAAAPADQQAAPMMPGGAHGMPGTPAPGSADPAAGGSSTPAPAAAHAP